MRPPFFISYAVFIRCNIDNIPLDIRKGYYSIMRLLICDNYHSLIFCRNVRQRTCKIRPAVRLAIFDRIGERKARTRRNSHKVI